MSWKQNDYLVLDVETTGLSPVAGDRVVEVAAIKIVDGKIVDQLHSLINPQRPISWGAFMVNQISDEMLRDAPTAKHILPQLISLAQNTVVVGHNIGFDLKFIDHECSLAGFDSLPRRHSIDTVPLSRRIVSGLRRYTLSSVAYELGINTIQEHRALGDVMITFDVFKCLMDIADRQDIDVSATLFKKDVNV